MNEDEKRKQAEEAKEDQQEDLELEATDAEDVAGGSEIYARWKIIQDTNTPPPAH